MLTPKQVRAALTVHVLMRSKGIRRMLVMYWVCTTEGEGCGRGGGEGGFVVMLPAVTLLPCPVLLARCQQEKFLHLKLSGKSNQTCDTFSRQTVVMRPETGLI